jgi:predicted KAP-like P-loop ATPase
LGKIIQYPIDLPAADKNEIDRFVIYSDSQGHKSHLDKLLDRLEIVGSRRNEFDKKSVELYSSGLSSFFPTLRNAKRFLIGLSVRLPVIKDEVCLLDFFLLEVLRVFANAVYQDIWTHSFYYVPPWSMKSMISSPFGLEYDSKGKDRRRERIKSHVETLLKDEVEKDNILEILKELFAPRIADAFGRPADYGDSMAATFRAEKRLTHPECFDKYFLLGVPKGMVSDASVEAMLASWEKAEDPDKKILDDLKTLKESRRLNEVLGRILMFVGRLNKVTIKPLLRSISRNIESIPMDGDRSEQDVQFKLVLFLLNERVSNDEKQVVAEAVVRDIGSIDVAVRIVNALRSD